jgi:hypothetical protein
MEQMTNPLDEIEYKKTLKPMRDITGIEKDVLDIWPYVDAIPAADLHGHELDDFVEYVYRTKDGEFDHVLLMTRTKNIYVVIVVDLLRDRVHGHHLLDINEKYGLNESLEKGGH